MENRPTATEYIAKQAVLVPVITDVPAEGLEASTPRTINLNFADGTKEVSVEFEYSNESIFVTPAGGGKASKRFEIDFKTGTVLNHKYVIEIKTVEKECFEPFDIVCFDENGKEYFRKHYRIRLIPEPERVRGVRQVLFWLRRHPSLIIPAALIVLVPLVGPEKLWSFFTIPFTPREPRHFTFAPPPPKEGIAPDEVVIQFADWTNKKWPDGWEMIQDPIVGQALMIKGNGIGVFKAPNDQESIYDMKLFLQLNVLDNQKSVSWLLRVRDDRKDFYSYLFDCIIPINRMLRVQDNLKDYYCFTLTFPTDESGAKLVGGIYKDNRRIGGLTTTTSPLQRAFYKLDPGDVLDITIDVKGQEFMHKVDIECIRDDSQNAKSGPRHWTFRDNTDDYYKWGAIGFESLGPDDITRLQYITIKSAK